MATALQAVRVRDLLEDAIVKGRFLPGDKLNPESLSYEFNCSRTPIREALKQLENSGLVTIAPKRGTFVSQLDVGELAERFEVMAEVEGICARLAARRISSEELKELKDAHLACHKLEKTGDIDGYYYKNTIFHACIYRASHNEFLAKEALRLHAALHPYRRIQLNLNKRMERSFSEHEMIVDEISAGNEEAAADAIRSHILIQGDSFNEFVASIKTLAKKALSS